ncbi:hypothetical protein BGX31_001495 [Mortierella sp. GBA43]|nr:hypothetical protein BGX31_001495 [Mortierella sp. GBA43]
MRFSAVAVIAVIASTVLAQRTPAPGSEVWPTYPVTGTEWYTTSGTQTIKWDLLDGVSTDKELKVQLLQGDPQSQTIVQELGTVKISEKKFTITLKKDLPSGFYSIRLGDTYTSYFVIKKDKKESISATLPATTTAVTTTTIASTAAPTTTTLATSTTVRTTTTTTSAPTPSNNSQNAGSSLKAGSALALSAAVAIAAVLAF